ncbi:sugar-binding transcriptional regulator [Promicromonospora iranensis]|uniref:sugar-binding transcriptional regulator n=1 Tax=Promicromonospora iranensis TaxID=1105144 RepID=UPI0023AA0D7A|nr:sugar-binding domain-containing protein [Promicromonospora iranensis]
MTHPDSNLIPNLLVEVSTDYYLDGKSKVEIARHRGISRFQVARLLAQARDQGVVRIEITAPRVDGERGARLAARLGLREILIAASGEDIATTRENVAVELAHAAREHITEGATVGVSWSRTVEAAVRHIGRLPQCDVVQLVGALPVEGSGNSLALINTFEQMPGVRTWPVWSPLLVADAATAAGMRRQPEIADALARADHLDVAVVAIGHWSDRTSTVYPQISPEEQRAATEAGAIAECSGRLFDAAGRPVRTSLDERVVGVTLEQLVATPQVIAIGYGAAVAPGLVAAVAGGVVDTLVVDDAAATALESLLE